MGTVNITLTGRNKEDVEKVFNVMICNSDIWAICANNDIEPHTCYGRLNWDAERKVWFFSQGVEVEHF